MTKKCGIPPDEETKRLASQLVDAAKKNCSSLTRIAFLLGFDENIGQIKKVEYHPVAGVCYQCCSTKKLLKVETKQQTAKGERIFFRGLATFCPECKTLWINSLITYHPGDVLAYFFNH